MTMEYSVFNDYLNLSSLIKSKGDSDALPQHRKDYSDLCCNDLGSDLIMLEQSSRTDPEVDHFSSDESSSVLSSLSNHLSSGAFQPISKSSSFLPLNPSYSDAVSKNVKSQLPNNSSAPLWMNFENGDVYYSSSGEFPLLTSSKDDDGHSHSLESVPSAHSRSTPSIFSRSYSSNSSQFHDSSRNSSPSDENAMQSPTLGNLISALQEIQDYQDTGVIGHGLVNPRRPLYVYEEKACALCKKNGETREFYTTHVLKDNRGKVICPILRKYVCPTCGATGDNAHTLRHCPINKAVEAARSTSSVPKFQV